MKAMLSGAQVNAPSNREMLIDEWAALATMRIISVSDTAPPLIRDQAIAFRDNIENVITYYMREAVRSDRYALAKNLSFSGHADVAGMVIEN